MFTLSTEDGFRNPVINIIYDDEEYTLHGVSSFKINYSTKGRGKGKGTKVTLSIMTPIIRNGVSDCRVETYTLPEDTKRVVELSTFWQDHAIKDTSDKKSTIKVN